MTTVNITDALTDEMRERLRKYAYWLRPYDQGRETTNPYADNSMQASIDLFTLLAREAALTKERDEALRECGVWARQAGEAKGRLEMSEAAGIVDGWRERAIAAEAQSAALTLKLEAAMEGFQQIADESVFNQMRFAEDTDTDYFLRCFKAVKEFALRRAAQLVADAPVAGEDVGSVMSSAAPPISPISNGAWQLEATAPKGEPVLVAWAQYGEREVGYKLIAGGWADTEGCPMGMPSHWMPLSAPPKDDVASEDDTVLRSGGAR